MLRVQVVKRHIDAGYMAAWLPEYRKVFVMFVVLSDIDYTQPNVIEKLQFAVRVVQEVVLSSLASSFDSVPLAHRR